MPLTDECFCSEIQYKITGQFVDPLSGHCSKCRKAFSAQCSVLDLRKSRFRRFSMVVRPRQTRFLRREERIRIAFL